MPDEKAPPKGKKSILFHIIEEVWVELPAAWDEKELATEVSDALNGGDEEGFNVATLADFHALGITHHAGELVAAVRHSHRELPPKALVILDSLECCGTRYTVLTRPLPEGADIMAYIKSMNESEEGEDNG